MKPPVVSVITPAYNARPYIARAVRSVLAQTFPDWELIVVDDRSTDGTYAYLQESFGEHPRVRLYRNEANRGPSFSRNFAFGEARGKWAALLDADDWWHPERLGRLLAEADAKKADAVADNLAYVLGEESTPYTTLCAIEGVPPIPRWLDPVFFIRHGEFGVVKPLLRLEFIRAKGLAYDERVRYGEDFLFYFRLLQAGARFYFLPQTYYYYRKHSGALTLDEVKLNEAVLQVVEELLHESGVRALGAEVVAALEARRRLARKNITYYRVVAPLKNGRYVEAAAQLLLHPQAVPVLVQRLPRLLGVWRRRRGRP
ncbi:MAG: glycosyltransferase family A protein [Bacillota bacterium]